jgi:hypothetical protein
MQELNVVRLEATHGVVSEEWKKRLHWTEYQNAICGEWLSIKWHGMYLARSVPCS